MSKRLTSLREVRETNATDSERKAMQIQRIHNEAEARCVNFYTKYLQTIASLEVDLKEAYELDFISSQPVSERTQNSENPHICALLIQGGITRDVTEKFLFRSKTKKVNLPWLRMLIQPRGEELELCVRNSPWEFAYLHPDIVPTLTIDQVKELAQIISKITKMDSIYCSSSYGCHQGSLNCMIYESELEHISRDCGKITYSELAISLEGEV